MTDAASAVAIIGMSGRFPGARDLEEFWANLRDGVCAITDFDTDELLAAGVTAEELGRPGYVPSRGHLADADRFDAELFGFNRAEAAALDPQHRLLLETAWAALEDAGYDPTRAPGHTGVYVGGSPTEHLRAAQVDRELATSLGALQVRILTDREFLASWISYRLGLDGPSMNIQTACSTSLTAVHLATQALLLGECDAALAGGVSVESVQPRGYLYEQGGILSSDGRCRPFDQQAGGTVPGSGVGVVVLRRLEDALADGDPVRAVIRGSAVTNDGMTRVGFVAPGVDRQTAAITEAWAAAGLEPASAQYVEMHGTGTALGDRIELAAATAAFATATDCRIGSVKSGIGHLDAAAGIAALVKTVLMLEHETLAPTVCVTEPSADLEASPFRVVEKTCPWLTPDARPRRAGVTSLGIGGTNVHVVLEQAPLVPSSTTAPHTEPLPVAAASATQLAVVARRLAAALRRADGPSLAATAHTLRTARTPLSARACVVAATAAEAVTALEAVTAGTVVGTAPEPLLDLARSWVRGEDVSWPEPRPGVRRVSLPTYPFGGERHGALPTGQHSPAAPAAAAGAVAERVAAVLRDALGLDPAATMDLTYFAAGGDSLTAVHLVGRLRDEFGIEVPITLFLEEESLRELTDRIVELGDGGGAAPLAALLDEIEGES